MSHITVEDANMEQTFRAADLAAMLRSEVFDLDDAAAFLGLETGSLWAALYRRRIRYVQYRTHKYFAVSDLIDYMHRRGTGLSSELGRERPIEVVTVDGKRVARECGWPEDLWP